MVDTRDLKSLGQKCPYGFDSRLSHKFFIKLLSMCEYQWKYQGCPYPICGIIFAPVVCPLDFKSCPNRNLIKNNNGTTKQKFTIEFEYPVMDAKVTAEELRNIISTGLKCSGWDIKVEEK